MPAYLYKCKVHNEFEVEHPITEKLTLCPLCKEQNLEPQPVTRLINSGSSFILLGGSWAKDNYR